MLYIIYRRFPELSSLDVASILNEKQDRAKEKILKAKFLRLQEKIGEKLAKNLNPFKEKVTDYLKKSKEKILALEKTYLKHQAETAAKPLSRYETLSAVEALLKNDDFPAAEKQLIELIARNKKDLEAYDRLGDLYMNNKNYDQAEEVFRYLIKLLLMKTTRHQTNPEDEMEVLSSMNVDNRVAKYYDDLGQIYELKDQPEKALDSYLKANVVEPNNPKYLDKIIELAIKVGDRGLAKKTFRRLKEINPENAKLGDILEQIDKMGFKSSIVEY